MCFREHLKWVGVNRTLVFTRCKSLRPILVQNLRAAFVTCLWPPNDQRLGSWTKSIASRAAGSSDIGVGRVKRRSSGLVSFCRAAPFSSQATV